LLATGTVPHALLQIFDDETAAFEAVATTFNRYTLLLDTYDPLRAIHIAVDVARKYRDKLGHSLVGVRLDSGDLLNDSRYVRSVLDQAGLSDVRVLASGDLDEFLILELLEAGAPIDVFGVGTSVGIAAGSAEHGVEGGALGGVYKAVQYADERGVSFPKMKVAGEKSTWPGIKEVWRVGKFKKDIIQLADEPKPSADVERLLKPVVLEGEVVPGSLPPLSEIWEFAQHNLRTLPDEYRQLNPRSPYPVQFSDRLLKLRKSIMVAHNGGGAAEAAPPVNESADQS
jgi:nicotinate phosphoribosyltransferase